MTTLEKDLAAVLNAHSRENESDTPDFLLAEYLLGCLAAYEKAARARDKWYGLAPEPGKINSPKELAGHIFAMGHNDDCMFCGFKDRIAKKILDEASEPSKGETKCP